MLFILASCAGILAFRAGIAIAFGGLWLVAVLWICAALARFRVRAAVGGIWVGMGILSGHAGGVLILQAEEIGKQKREC